MRFSIHDLRMGGTASSHGKGITVSSFIIFCTFSIDRVACDVVLSLLAPGGENSIIVKITESLFTILYHALCLIILTCNTKVI